MKSTLYYAVFLTVTAMLVTAVAILGYNLTAPIIEENRIANIERNIAILFSPEEGFSRNENQNDNSYQEKSYKGLNEVYEVLDNDGNIHALIYNVSAQGRNDMMSALIAVNPYTDKIIAVTYYDHAETPNIGEKYTRDEEIESLLGQPVSNVEVDVIANASTTWIAIREMFDIIERHYDEQGVHLDG